MHLVPLVLYAAAAAAYLAHFAWRDPRTGRLATSILASSVLAHTFLIGMQTVQAGHAPLVGTTAAISAFVWLLALSYLYVELTSDERSTLESLRHSPNFQPKPGKNEKGFFDKMKDFFH